jgi:hypothetical protein
MILPPIQNRNPIQDPVFLFAAADENYFNNYAKFLVNSAKKHLNFPVHLHLYNPSQSTKDWCISNSVSFTFEDFDPDILRIATDNWKRNLVDPEDIRKRGTMIKDINDHTRLEKEVVRTYYACTRFIRLSEILDKPAYVIMLDTDSLIRKKFTLPSQDVDIHIFEKNRKKHVSHDQHLASTIFYTGTDASLNLIRDHAEKILRAYKNDHIYWFLDQETLDVVIQKYKKKPLDVALVDFRMTPDSPIWCAKGPRKFENVYLNELSKYS